MFKQLYSAGQRLVPPLLLSVLALSGNTYAQDLPDCVNAVADPDLEGLGIEENGDSCVLPAPNIINASTGEPVNFTRARWRPEDVAGNRSFSCSFLFYEEGFDGSMAFRFARGIFSEINPPVDQTCVDDGQRPLCGGEGQIYTPDFDSYSAYSVENGVFRGNAGSAGTIFWIDADAEVENGFRTWTDDDANIVCVGASPSGTAPDDQCIDTPPAGDGWGWNGVTSCRIAGAAPEPGECIDSDPVGDGWGWDGVTSCRIAAEPAAEPACIDTDPVGDGWGWNGSTSCRVTSNNPAACYDFDGDGWGWDGSNSCRP